MPRPLAQALAALPGAAGNTGGVSVAIRHVGARPGAIRVVSREPSGAAEAVVGSVEGRRARLAHRVRPTISALARASPAAVARDVEAVSRAVCRYIAGSNATRGSAFIANDASIACGRLHVDGALIAGTTNPGVHTLARAPADDVPGDVAGATVAVLDDGALAGARRVIREADCALSALLPWIIDRRANFTR